MQPKPQRTNQFIPLNKVVWHATTGILCRQNLIWLKWITPRHCCKSVPLNNALKLHCHKNSSDLIITNSCLIKLSDCYLSYIIRLIHFKWFIHSSVTATKNSVLINWCVSRTFITWSDDILSCEVTKLLMLGLRNLAMFDSHAWKQHWQWRCPCPQKYATGRRHY